MKAIRGDNPRTTNQRVYLMPVVSPPPPPERPPDARRGTVFPLFPTPAIRAALSLSVYPSIYLPRAVSLSRFLFSLFLLFTLVPFSLRFFVPPVGRPLLPPPAPLPSRTPVLAPAASSRCCSRICHYATDITNPPRSLLISRVLVASRSLLSTPRTPPPPRVLFATCRTFSRIPARSSAISAIILIFMPTPPPPPSRLPFAVASSRILSLLRVSPLAHVGDIAWVMPRAEKPIENESIEHSCP